MSLVGGKADVPTAWLELLLLAKSRSQRGALESSDSRTGTSARVLDRKGAYWLAQQVRLYYLGLATVIKPSAPFLKYGKAWSTRMLRSPTSVFVGTS